MARSKLLIVVAAAAFVAAAPVAAQVRRYPLETTQGLRLHNVDAAPVVLQGKKGLRLTLAAETARKLEGLAAAERGEAENQLEQLAWIDGSEFSSGVIEAEIAGAPGPGAGTGARGFVGIAFRVQEDRKTYDAFYLRPTNGRADDQERRNHAAQYIGHPDWPWFRLRKETPSRYEAYVDLVPGEWTKVRIEVRGDRARLFVHGHEQPTLIVNDVKSGGQAKGAVALWIGPGTIAHFRDLSLAP